MNSSDITAIVLAIITLVTLMWKSISSFMSRKLKSPEDIRKDKELDDQANDVALTRLKQLIAESDERHKEEIQRLKKDQEEKEREWERKFKEMEIRVNEINNRNGELVRFSYACISVIRNNGLLELLPKDVPPGIYL
jgi:Na+-transporting methylmalonyl-CoA/oxaloacetate decarboxylase gamma subunit